MSHRWSWRVSAQLAADHRYTHYRPDAARRLHTCINKSLSPDNSDPVSLTVSPDSSQHFEYERLTLKCSHNSTTDRWKIYRFTNTSNGLSVCGNQWGAPTSMGCIIHTIKQTDSAIYWCESPSRQRSNTVTVNVYGKSPVPVKYAR